jgi:hypothetical protein
VNKQDINIIRNSEENANPENIAELFNSYFCTISELLKKKGIKFHILRLAFKNKEKY